MNAAGDVRGKAVRGIAWTIATGFGTRLLQMGGTLAITHFVRKDALGEVMNAAVVALTAHSLSTFGIPHYLVSRKTDRTTAWHATLTLALSGILALAITLALVSPIARWIKTPNLAHYLPLLALSTLLGRVATVPERLLQQELRFREASRARAGGELAYTVLSLGTALLGAGGMAIVAGNLARSVWSLTALSLAMPPAVWAKPHRFERPILRDMLAFGAPMGVAFWMTFAARNADNLVVSSLFGAAVVAVYNLAYNLADIPASQIGEQVGDVLAPTFLHLDGERRKAGLLRATALLGTIVFPLAIGLGVCGPTIASTLLPASWSSIGPMLTLLSALSIARPVGWTIGSYLQVTQHTRAVMMLTAFRLVVLLAAVATLGRAFGPLGACAGVGVGFGLHALASSGLVVRIEGISARGLASAVLRPLVACLPLVAAVLGTRALLVSWGVHLRGVGLAAEIVAGAIGYALGAFVFARPLVRDLIGLVAELRRGRAGVRTDAAAGSNAAV